MIEFIISCVIFFVFAVFNIRKSLIYEITGSDHYVHLSWINFIKYHRHKFPLTDPSDITLRYVCDPFLYHWVLSFFPKIVFEKYFNFITLIIRICSIVLFYMFLNQFKNVLEFDENKILICVAFFIVFPFSYSAWNAKNYGLSARELGLFIVNIYVYSLVSYLYNSTETGYAILILCSLFIFLSSIFAMQFMLLSAPIIALFSGSLEFIFIPFFGAGLFYLLNPKFAISYLKGRFGHSYNYAKHLAHVFILMDRNSIYRDFVWDFFLKFRSSKSIKSAFYYFVTNPIVELILLFPFIWFVNIHFGSQSSFLDCSLAVLFSSIILFISTSFRFSRFLGEPQRYVEITAPLLVLLCVNNTSEYMLQIIFLYCVLVVFAQFYLRFIYSSNTVNNSQELIEQISLMSGKYGLVASNDSEALKYFFKSNYIGVGYDYTTPIRSREDFDSIFQNDMRIYSLDYLNIILKKYDVAVVLINTDFNNLKELGEKVSLDDYKIIWKNLNYIIYAK